MKTEDAQTLAKALVQEIMGNAERLRIYTKWDDQRDCGGWRRDCLTERLTKFLEKHHAE